MPTDSRNKHTERLHKWVNRVKLVNYGSKYVPGFSLGTAQSYFAQYLIVPIDQKSRPCTNYDACRIADACKQGIAHVGYLREHSKLCLGTVLYPNGVSTRMETYDVLSISL